MSLRSHLLPRNSELKHRPPGAADPEHPDPAESGADAAADQEAAAGGRVFLVQRTGALLVAVFLLVFGLLGFAGGLEFFSTAGERVLGLSSNGLLSALSVFVAAVLMGADLRGPRVASTVMIVVGSLFLVSALVNLALLRTSFNFLAFEMSNVLFSIGVGLALLTLGAYGRVSGNLPPDSPYAHQRAEETEPPESYPTTPEEFAAETAMRAAEIAVSNHVGTDDQRRRVQAMARVHTRGDRRRVWMEFDPPQSRESDVLPQAPTTSDHPVLARAAGLARGRRQGDGRPSGK
jgi:hypothetical protein